MDLFSLGLICQTFARWNPAIALVVGGARQLCVNNIYRNASEAQRRQYLPGSMRRQQDWRARPDRNPAPARWMN